MSCVGSKTASDETELAEMEKAHTRNVADMCRQRQVLVDNVSKVTDSARRLDAGVRQLKRVNSALRYDVTRRVDPSQMTSVLAGLRHRRLLAIHAPIRVMQSAMRAMNVADWAGLT